MEQFGLLWEWTIHQNRWTKLLIKSKLYYIDKFRQRIWIAQNETYYSPK